jgi:hypothetical protein
MKTAFVLIPLLSLTACLPSKKVSPDTSSGNINASAPYLWSSTVFPKALKYSDSFDPDEIANISAMTVAWETAIANKKDFFQTMTSTPEVSSPTMNLDALGRDSVNGVYKITNWPTSLPGSALAVTQIFGRRYNIGASDEYVRIEHADILVNDNLYDFRTDDNDNHSKFDLRIVILHEIGHYLGLPHRALSSNSIMIPSIQEETTNRAPTTIDRDDMASKYSVNLGSTPMGANALSGPVNEFSPKSGDPGQEIKILIELHANGDCVHKEDGVVIQRHPAKN